ncbi:Uncharacterized protein OBRU01_09055 [Operophtera brumata]|uniref:Zinc finger DNA binding protein n=1 Tax=Operophtera brumata TaxID=104452 RepID=A0A0L7LH50_OPEBR|nr:Uncharacterized protein OBRU01_09055 [Operophtera brumata]
MAKCARCNKTVTKKAPGLECSRCGGLTHASTTCTDLSNKQLNILKSAENLDWTCSDCKQKSPFRKTSFIIPEDDMEDDDAGSEKSIHLPINTSKFLSDISSEMEKSIKKELKETNQCLQFLSDKVDDYLEIMETFKEKIHVLENKNSELINKNKHLEIKVGALEQRMNEIQQSQLVKLVEIVGIPVSACESLDVIAKNLAKKLDMKVEDVKTIKRLPAKQGKPDTIQLTMREEVTKSRWISAARSMNLVAADVAPNVEASRSRDKLFIRQALTQHLKNVLWKAKQALKDTHKFVWCKEGKVLVRKTDQSKIIVLRSETDITNLVKSS